MLKNSTITGETAIACRVTSDHKKAINSIIQATEKTIWTADATGKAFIWDKDTLMTTNSFPLQPPALLYSPGIGEPVCYSYGVGTVSFLDTQTQQISHTTTVGGSFNVTCFSMGANYLWITARNVLCGIERRSGAVIRMPAQPSPFTCLLALGDVLLTGCTSGDVCTWIFCQNSESKVGI